MKLQKNNLKSASGVAGQQIICERHKHQVEERLKPPSPVAGGENLAGDGGVPENQRRRSNSVASFKLPLLR